MLYTEFIKKAIDVTIAQADNGLYYLEPMWRLILNDNKLLFSDISDFEISPEEVSEVLKLEVEKRNTIASPKPFIEDWIFETITSTIEPAMLEQENEFVKNLIELRKMKGGDTDGDKELNNIVPFPVKE